MTNNKKILLLSAILLNLFCYSNSFAFSCPNNNNEAHGPCVPPEADFNFANTFHDMDKDGSLNRLCEKVKNTHFPSADRPTLAEANELNSHYQQTSDDYYYGIDVPVDYIKARHAAFLEMGPDDTLGNLIFGGSDILMMIYANGYGVKRNLDLAIHIACFTDGAPAEIGGRIDHLNKMKAQKEPDNFDLCDDITSGDMEGRCANEANIIAQAKRESELTLIQTHWTEREKQAFKQLKATADDYFAAASDSETDLSGTARDAMTVEAKDDLETSFNQSFQNFEQGQLPHYSVADFNRSNTELDATYKKAMQMATVYNENYGDTVTADDIQAVQQAWRGYCDAWVKFAAVRYPQVSAISWQTWLIKERIKALQNII